MAKVRPLVNSFVVQLISLALTFSIAFATPAQLLAQSTGMDQTDFLTNQLLNAMAESNPETRQKLFDDAIQKARDEGIDEATIQVVISLIPNLPVPPAPQATADGKPKKQPYDFLITGEVSPDQVSSAGKMLAKSSDGQRMMWKIQTGRFSRDSNYMDYYVQQYNGGRGLDYFDARDRYALPQVIDAGWMVKALMWLGLVNKDYSAATKKMRTNNMGVSIDDLASQIIERAAWWSAPWGGLSIIAQYGAGDQTWVDWVRRLGPVSAENLITFAIQYDMILKLSDLYGVGLGGFEQETLATTIWALGKGFESVIKNKITPNDYDKLAAQIAVRTGESFQAAYDRLMNFVNGKLVQNASARVGVVIPTRGGSVPTQPTLPGPNGPPPAAGAPGTIGTAGGWLLFGGVVVLGSAISGLETYAIGKFAQNLLNKAHQRNYVARQCNFLTTLLSDRGDAYLKLLSFVYGGGTSIPQTIDIAQDRSGQMIDYVSNIAQTAGVCAPEGTPASRLPYAQTFFANCPNLQHIKDPCAVSGSRDRFERLRQSFMGLNEVKPEEFASLRTDIYDNRLTMADIVLQMQFLKGDRNQADRELFAKIIKVLGTENPDDLNHFSELHAYIAAMGGMAPDMRTPAGYRIKTMQPDHYMEIGFIDYAAPEAWASRLNAGNETYPGTQPPRPIPVPGGTNPPPIGPGPVGPKAVKPPRPAPVPGAGDPPTTDFNPREQE